MLKNKKFWTYETCQAYDLRQEQLESVKVKGRFYEDVNALYDIMATTPHPSLKLLYGKDYIEPSVISFNNILVDINTLKILFNLLHNTKIVTLRFSTNNFEIETLEFLVNNLLNTNGFKSSNIYSVIIDWNDKITKDKNLISIFDKDLTEYYNEIILNSKSLLTKLCSSNKLESLSLRGNYLGDECALEICNYLKLNPVMKVINLYKNNFTSKSITAFCSMFESNKILEEINLGGNFFTDSDLELLSKSIGKIEMSTADHENYIKRLKERDLILEKNKRLKIQKKPEEPIPFVEEVTLIGETNYVIKNINLKVVNLMQNKFTENCCPFVYNILNNFDTFCLILDLNIFSKLDRDKLLDINEPYENKIYLAK